MFFLSETLVRKVERPRVSTYFSNNSEKSETISSLGSKTLYLFEYFRLLGLVLYPVLENPIGV